MLASASLSSTFDSAVWKPKRRSEQCIPLVKSRRFDIVLNGEHFALLLLKFRPVLSRNGSFKVRGQRRTIFFVNDLSPFFGVIFVSGAEPFGPCLQRLACDAVVAILAGFVAKKGQHLLPSSSSDFSRRTESHFCDRGR